MTSSINIDGDQRWLAKRLSRKPLFTSPTVNTLEMNGWATTHNRPFYAVPARGNEAPLQYLRIKGTTRIASRYEKIVGHSLQRSRIIIYLQYI